MGNGGRAFDEEGPSYLLIDDDEELCEMMREFFARRGLRLVSESNSRCGLTRALRGGIDLLILDVMLPELDGFELLRLIRRQSDVPIIMLTARTDQVDRVAGLDAGADDYLPKPFGPEELLARIRAVLRRAGKGAVPIETLEVAGLRLIPATRIALHEGVELSLTTTEFDLLERLVRAAGRILTRDELSVSLYRRKLSPFDRALDVHVSNIRRKLGSDAGLIQTIRGTGYLFRPATDPHGAG